VDTRLPMQDARRRNDLIADDADWADSAGGGRTRVTCGSGLVARGRTKRIPKIVRYSFERF
jgi:hypothetical protein